MKVTLWPIWSPDRWTIMSKDPYIVDQPMSHSSSQEKTRTSSSRSSQLAPTASVIPSKASHPFPCPNLHPLFTPFLQPIIPFAQGTFSRILTCVLLEDFVPLEVTNRKSGNPSTLKSPGRRGRGMDGSEGAWRRIPGLEESEISSLRGMEVKNCSAKSKSRHYQKLVDLRDQTRQSWIRISHGTNTCHPNLYISATHLCSTVRPR